MKVKGQKLKSSKSEPKTQLWLICDHCNDIILTYWWNIFKLYLIYYFVFLDDCLDVSCFSCGPRGHLLARLPGWELRRQRRPCATRSGTIPLTSHGEHVATCSVWKDECVCVNRWRCLRTTTLLACRDTWMNESEGLPWLTVACRVFRQWKNWGTHRLQAHIPSSSSSSAPSKCLLYIFLQCLNV